MNLHLLFFLLLLLFAISLGLSPNEQKKKIFLFVAFCLILFERSFVDPFSMPDLDSYYSTFYDISKIDILKSGAIADYQYTHKEETGFLVFLKITSFLTSDFNVVLVIFGTIWLMAFSYIITKYSSNLVLSYILLFLLVYGQSLFVLRQHLAIPIILLTYDAIISRKLVRFIILVLIASSFHTSAIIWFPMYFFYASKKPYYVVAVIVLVVFGLTFAISNIDFLNSRMVIDYSSYINQNVLNDNNNIPLVIGAFYGICYFLFMKKNVLNDGLNRLLFISIFIDIILFAVSDTLVLVTRLALYYHVAIIFIVPLTTKAINNSIVTVVYTVFTIAIFTYIQFMGSFFVNLRNIKLISLSIEHIVSYILACFVFYAFYYKVLRPYLGCSTKKKRQLMNIKLVRTNE